MMNKLSRNIKHETGFTLVELMVVVVIVAIFAAIAIPSYQQYIRRAIAAQTQQEMQKLAEQLERHKARNFSYRGFNADYLYRDNSTPPVVISAFDSAQQTLTLPLQATGTSIKYTLEIVDNATSNPLLTASTSTGQGWAIKAITTDPRNFNLLLTSTGTKCKTTVAIDEDEYADCGNDGENW